MEMLSESRKNSEPIMTKEHSICVFGRSRTVIKGVTDVSEFSDREVSLATDMGKMLIKGADLSISKLDTTGGDVEINGSIDLIEYSKKQKPGFFAGLLK